MSKKIKAVVFDAYGTLFDVHSVIAACDQYFPTQGSRLSGLWRAKQLEYTWLRSLMGRYEDFWKVTESALLFACKNLGLSSPPATRAQLMDGYLNLKLFPEVPQALSSLSDYTLAILSNGSPRMLQAAVKSAGLEGVFARVMSVDEVKIYKPNPQVYRLAPRKLKVARTAIAFVSSNFWDVAGAKAFGFWTCWVNRSGAPPDELSLSPDVIINTLTDLPDLIKA